jgi:spore germination protein YaaH
MRIQNFNFIAVALVLGFVVGCVSPKPSPVDNQNQTIYPSQDLLLATNAEPGSTFEIEVYIVKKGDTLSHIAATFQVTVRDLQTLNSGLTPFMQVGQKIRIYERKIQ